MTGKQPFEAVVTEHGGTVLRVCRAILGPADADDAWSETFLAAMRAYPDLPAGANVEAWLVTIAHRKAIDVTRAAARRAVPVAQTPDDAAAGPADSQSDGLPYADIAAIVGGSADAVRRAAADGIATLRRTYLDAAGAASGTGAASRSERRDT